MESNINDTTGNNNKGLSEKSGKPKSKKDKSHLQTADSQEKVVEGGGAQSTPMQLRLENDKPRIRSSQGSVS